MRIWIIEYDNDGTHSQAFFSEKAALNAATKCGGYRNPKMKIFNLKSSQPRVFLQE